MGVIGAFGMIAVSLLSLPAPYMMKIVIDQAIAGKDLRLLNTVILALFGVQLLMFGASWVTNYSFNRFSLDIMTRIKKDLFHRILRFPMSFFAQHQTGYIMSRVGEVEGLNLFFSSTLVYVVISIARFVFCLGLLVHLNAKLTAISLLFLPLLFWITRWFTGDLRQIAWQYYEKAAVISRGMQDSLSGIEVVKTFGAETREATKFQLHLNELKDMNIRKTVLMSLYSESLSFLGAGAGFVILWWSGWKIISGQFTLGSYLAFSAYFAQLLGPMQLLANLGLTLQPAKVALQRTREILQIVAEDEPVRSRSIVSL
jgi:ABC-type bacteriocin/lantibiotic exporter with double-glycine peptidase domain